MTKEEADKLVEQGKAMYFLRKVVLEYNNEIYLRNEDRTHHKTYKVWRKEE